MPKKCSAPRLACLASARAATVREDLVWSLWSFRDTSSSCGTVGGSRYEGVDDDN